MNFSFEAPFQKFLVVYFFNYNEGEEEEGFPLSPFLLLPFATYFSTKLILVGT